MVHINEIALIQSVELSQSLIDWNTDNNALRVRLRFAYQSEEKEDKEADENLLSLSDFESAGAVVNKSYTCLINFDSLVGEEPTEKQQKEAVKKLAAKFEGKKARFSTFDFTISELTDGKESVVNNETRDYSSLSNSYLGKVDDTEGELKKLKSRLQQYVDEGDFKFGSKDD